MSSELEKFKTLLDGYHTWPAKYPFKFIGLPEKIEIVKEILEGAEISIKESKQGKYLSLSAELHVSSSDEVMVIYEKVSLLKGVIAL